jgi:Glycoside hydrolase family 44
MQWRAMLALLVFPFFSLMARADTTVYANGALGVDWNNWSWSCGNVCAAPVKDASGALAIDLGHWSGAFFAFNTVAGIASSDTLQLRVNIPAALGGQINIALQRRDAYGGAFPQKLIALGGFTPDAQGFARAIIPMRDLNPSGLPFDGIQMQATSDLNANTLLRIAELSFVGVSTITPQSPQRIGVSANPTAATASATIDCSIAKPINPKIYGIAYSELAEFRAGAGGNQAQWSLGATGRRWGGNTTTRLNPDLNAWNLANDYYFENIGTRGWQAYLNDNAQKNTASVVSIPTLGWVAKDLTSNGFSISQYGAQQSTDQYRPDAGNGRKADGTYITPTQPATQTSKAFTPANAAAWVTQLKAQAALQGGRIDHFILDNEPDLWSDTHRDVRTTRLRAADLLQNTKDYAGAIRRAEPGVKIAGPSLSSLFAMRFTDYDNNNQLYSGGPGSDRALMGGGDFAPWYLKELKNHQNATGEKLLDILDTHYYPQSDNVYGGGLGGIDLATARLRIRSTRSVWDADYIDESWYGRAGNPPVNLFPTLQKWVADNNPGLGLSIGEYSWGGEHHVSGAIAQAEIFGRMAQAGIESAYYWTYPDADSPVSAVFRGFRNFDGKGLGFGENYLATTVSPAANSSAALISAFGSRHNNGMVIAALINLTDDKRVTTNVTLSNCLLTGGAAMYSYDASTPGFVAQPEKFLANQSVAIESAPWSITFLHFRPVALPATQNETVTVTEFYAASSNHYFLTANPQEAANLNANPSLGWAATGERFQAYGNVNAPADSAPVCRFYGDQTLGPNSHFYTANAAECAQLKALQKPKPSATPQWNFEENAFAISLPNAQNCAAGTTPIYRAYNNRFAQNDSNHRHLTNKTLYDSMIAKGWSGEGVVMCAAK